MRLAVLWSRFGPYHFARLRATAHRGAPNVIVSGIEVAEVDSAYAWAVVPGTDAFERYALFPGRDYARLGAREIRSAVRGALNAIKPDVVAINGWSVPEARAALSWCQSGSGATAVLMSETKEDDVPRRWWKELAKKKRVSRFQAALAGGVMQREYLIKLGMPGSRIFLGYDVINNAHFARGAVAARQNASALRQTLGLPPEYFFCCTRLLARKNVDGLLTAYAAYRTQCEGPWGLVIAGSGPELSNLRALERSLGLASAVIWPGFLQYEQLPIYYGLASAFIHPARSEAWGLVVNEAAASVLPLLVSHTVGARYELVEHGSNGLLFDPNQPQAICDALLEMTRVGANKRAAMGQRSCAIVERWTPDRFARGLLAAADLSLSAQSRAPSKDRAPGPVI